MVYVGHTFIAMETLKNVLKLQGTPQCEQIEHVSHATVTYIQILTD